MANTDNTVVIALESLDNRLTQPEPHTVEFDLGLQRPGTQIGEDRFRIQPCCILAGLTEPGHANLKPGSAGAASISLWC